MNRDCGQLDNAMDLPLKDAKDHDNTTVAQIYDKLLK